MQYFTRLITPLILLFAVGASNFAHGAFVLPERIQLPVHGNSSSNDTVRIKGSATKGPIANAAVSVYEIDDMGFPVGSAVATTTTDSAGGFTLSLPSFDEILLVQTSGGSFLDESDTRPLAQRRHISLTSSQGFMSIVEPGQSTVAVTPFTDAFVERARIGGRLGGFDDVMKSIIQASTEGFGFSMFTTDPPDPSNPGSATEAQLQYAMAIGTIANMANVTALRMGMPAPTYEVIKAVIYDISDGDDDGLMDGRPIMVGNKTYSRVDFEQQLIRFRNNNYASYGATPMPDWEDSDILLLGVPPFFYGVSENENIPRQFGIAAFHWGKVILNADGTGTYSNWQGEGQFNWAGAAGTLVLDFTAFGGYRLQDFTTFEFNAATGQQEQFDAYNVIERMDVFVGLTSTGKEALFGEAEYRGFRTNVSTGEVVEFTFEVGINGITIYDAANIVPIDDPATFEFDPALLAYNDEAVLSDGSYFSGIVNDVDVMSFNADGTGTSKYDNDAFTWELRADGRLRVDFDNGETAIYTLLFDDDPELGSYVAVDYQKDGEEFHHGVTVVTDDPAASWDPADIIGIVESPGSEVLNNGELIDSPVILYYRPDGTGLLEFRATDYETGHQLITSSSRTFCWDIDNEGYLERRRVRPSSSSIQIPTPQQCQSFTGADVQWIRSLDLMQQDGEEAEAVVRFIDNENCLFTANTGCGAPNQVFSTFPSKQKRIHTYTANPLFAVWDFANTTVGSPVTIDVLSNDQPGDNDVDVSTLEVVVQPTNGNFARISGASASVDSSGRIVVDPGTSSGIMYINYQVSDTAGNLSNVGLIRVDVQP